MLSGWYMRCCLFLRGHLVPLYSINLPPTEYAHHFLHSQFCPVPTDTNTGTP
ncbi:hypothetical protein PROFUN_06449 [Planoprotostelium fungivorum]|uniref:Uncharacterized protein n=1 Tax=Planoprotostelium fungivorum TaxID=1890364 RepID=A0A2P6MQZ8_9EUKA|nr:hypothetical protein PROFUN_06449 [Planoprotostelium fungivorum]